jgi:hypothetical protein
MTRSTRSDDAYGTPAWALRTARTSWVTVAGGYDAHSRAELSNLIEAAEKVCTSGARKSPAPPGFGARRVSDGSPKSLSKTILNARPDGLNEFSWTLDFTSTRGHVPQPPGGNCRRGVKNQMALGVPVPNAIANVIRELRRNRRCSVRHSPEIEVESRQGRQAAIANRHQPLRDRS